MINLREYRFSVIYSVEVAKGVRLTSGYFPPDFKKNGWYMTEAGPAEDLPGWRHRKYCVAFLSFDQFCEFLSNVGLCVEKCHTMGSIGAPGFGIYAAPAVPFTSYSEDVLQNAYVTPCPPQMFRREEHTPVLPGFDPEMVESANRISFDDVEMEMWRVFKDGAFSAKQLVA